MSGIGWLTNLGYAEDSAMATRKPILLYYFDPGCIGCQRMDTVTYSSSSVGSFIRECLIPLAVEVSKKPYYERYNAIWTPTLLLLDFQGNEIQRNVGFMDVDDFLACMHLGIAKVHLNINEFAAANEHFKRILKSFPQSFVVPEAIFFQGVNAYKASDDPAKLRQVYERLQAEYPENGWTRKSVPYQSLK